MNTLYPAEAQQDVEPRGLMLVLTKIQQLSYMTEQILSLLTPKQEKEEENLSKILNRMAESIDKQNVLLEQIARNIDSVSQLNTSEKTVK
ncbi:hypothetical protein [Neokomagataea thailandica]|uniref:Uncharacterized protein n=1 Tax=Neokomagataea tanensis NBRC 106556 TaxID=1223519 RepID=A0ABQ0QL89_9PROT|nr:MULTISPECIES: hypothetical protein [Neokomagataea]GBR48995.1 hypothetical protein AA106556_1918 [Neokomagataea tanensis NBRC 106556]